MKKLTLVMLLWTVLLCIGTTHNWILLSNLHAQADQIEQETKKYQIAKQESEVAYNNLLSLSKECESYLASIDTINIYAQQYNVDPKIILAVSKLESNFDASAQNGKYLGFMQLDENYFGSKMEALNLDRNIECGASVLSGLKVQSNDLHYILNSYNMGKQGYQNYVARTGKVSRAYSERAIEIINKLKGSNEHDR